MSDVIRRHLKEENRQHEVTLEAGRIRQAVQVLAGATALTGIEEIAHPESDPATRDTGILQPEDLLSDLTSKQVQEVLSLRVFDPATFGRVRFHHRSIREFIAAESLELMELSEQQLQELLFAHVNGRYVLRKSLAAVASWLAPRHPGVQEQLLESDLGFALT